YTEEIRERGQRRGFRAVSFDGRAWDLAHVGFRDAAARVGRYGVDVGVMDALAETLGPRQGVDAWLVDEIGRMECLSPAFVTAMRALLAGAVPLVATVAQRGGGFISEVKRRREGDAQRATGRARHGGSIPDSRLRAQVVQARADHVTDRVLVHVHDRDLCVARTARRARGAGTTGAWRRSRSS